MIEFAARGFGRRGRPVAAWQRVSCVDHCGRGMRYPCRAPGSRADLSRLPAHADDAGRVVPARRPSRRSRAKSKSRSTSAWAIKVKALQVDVAAQQVKARLAKSQGK
jgi:hypothetical protein